MATAVTPTGITFGDATSQTTAYPGTSGGDYIVQQWTSPTVWTKPGTIKAIKVTVVGAGGNGGATVTVPGGNSSTQGAGGGGGGAAILYLDAPAIPASPITITAGPGTNSFGPLVSATAGSAGASTTASFPNVNTQAGGAGGTGISGTININGQYGFPNGMAPWSGRGGNSILGFGGQEVRHPAPSTVVSGVNGQNYGGGGGGSARNGGSTPPGASGGTGAPGIVIVEEFY